MALFSGLAGGHAYYDGSDARGATLVSLFSKFAALVKRNWRRLAAGTAPSRGR